MGVLLTLLGVLMVLQTLFWLAALRRINGMAPRPTPPDQIKVPSIKIGIQEGRGGTMPAPRPGSSSR